MGQTTRHHPHKQNSHITHVYVLYVWIFLSPPDSDSHTLTTVWSNLNLHPEKPLPWWQTNLNPHPDALSFSHSFSFPLSLHLFSVCHLQPPDSPMVVAPPATINHTGENGFGLGLWAGWPQVRRLASGSVLVLGFGV